MSLQIISVSSHHNRSGDRPGHDESYRAPASESIPQPGASRPQAGPGAASFSQVIKTKKRDGYYARIRAFKSKFLHLQPRFISMIRAGQSAKGTAELLGVPKHLCREWVQVYIQSEMLPVPASLLKAIPNFRWVPRVNQKQMLAKFNRGVSIREIKADWKAAWSGEYNTPYCKCNQTT